MDFPNSKIELFTNQHMKCNNNSSKDDEIPKKIYNGCFKFDPKEIGFKIERPSAPSNPNSKNCNMSFFTASQFHL